MLSKTKEFLNKKGIKQWEEGWEIDDLKNKCKNGYFYVFYDKGNIIGCYCIERNPGIEWIKDKEYTYLSSLCLLPLYQGKGLGKILIESAIENSTKIIYLDCFSENDKLKSFYQNNGFKYIKDIPEKNYFVSIFKKE